MTRKMSESKILLTVYLYLLIGLSSLNPISGSGLVHHVNPFIGTEGGGNTFPGAVVPWGMISISPHTAPGTPSGYLHGYPHIYGFGHNHLSGTGCADLGNVIVTAVKHREDIAPEKYRSAYKDESASPGYYHVMLEKPQVKVETTVSIRSGMMKFTSEKDGSIRLLIDIARNLNGILGGSIKIINNREITGYSNSGGFCGEDNRKPVYFVIRADRPSAWSALWHGEKFTDMDTLFTVDESAGAVMEFSDIRTGDSILIKTGISYVSIENARENLEHEISHWNFNEIRNDASKKWETKLSRIIIETDRKDDKIKFYTALYHSLIHPNIISDANGQYPVYQSGSTGAIDNHPRYSVFSLWDTYRTLHPFLTLVFPEKQLEMVSSMTAMAREWGWLPKWELVSNETYMMVGDPASVVVADTYLKGIRDFDIETAYQAMKRTIVEAGTNEAMPSRPGYHELKQYGYIPFEQDWSTDWWVWGPVSTGLEYNYADWAVSLLARELGHHSDADEFFQLSKSYRNIFNQENNFMQPRLKNGSWYTPFDPLETEGSGDWVGSGGPGYVEGNAWNYTWFVNHDVKGLIDLFGGEEYFREKLTACFDRSLFTITNEPDMAYPYLFTYLKGGGRKTGKIIHELVEREFSAGPGGLPGNDDAGAISTWYLFSVLGFYPVDPVSRDYRLSLPMVKSARIRLDDEFYPGTYLVIVNETGPGEFDDIDIFFNEVLVEHNSLSHDQITSGGILRFKHRIKE